MGPRTAADVQSQHIWSQFGASVVPTAGTLAILCAMVPEHLPDLSAFSESGLFSLYRAILGELKGRRLIRTENAPAGDYAEHLVVTALGGQLADNS